MSDRNTVCLSPVERKKGCCYQPGKLSAPPQCPWFSKIQGIKWRKEALFFWILVQDNWPCHLLFSHLIFCSGSTEFERRSEIRRVLRKCLQISFWIWGFGSHLEKSPTLTTDPCKGSTNARTKNSPWECQGCAGRVRWAGNLCNWGRGFMQSKRSNVGFGILKNPE